MSSSSKPCPCLAVTHEDGAEIIVWDTSGTPRTYFYKGDPKNLCFHSHPSCSSSHWNQEENENDFKTLYNFSPHFDAQGRHYDPEESCVCGVTTPHLHMHAHNHPHTEEPGEETDGDWTSVTLHAKTEDDEREPPGRHMPSSCRIDQDPSKEVPEELILETDCEACGERCGRFPLVGKRNLNNNVQVHFFEAKLDTKSFHWGECFQYNRKKGSIFDTSSNRTQTAKSPISKSSTASPSRVIRAKQGKSPRSKGGSIEKDGYFEKISLTIPPLSSEMAKLVRLELDKCSEEDECFLHQTHHHGHGHEHEHHKHSHAKKGCCSSEKNSSCSSKKKENQDSHHTHHHHGHEHGHREHTNASKGCGSSEKNLSCCSNNHHHHHHKHGHHDHSNAKKGCGSPGRDSSTHEHTDAKKCCDSAKKKNHASSCHTHNHHHHHGVEHYDKNKGCSEKKHHESHHIHHHHRHEHEHCERSDAKKECCAPEKKKNSSCCSGEKTHHNHHQHAHEHHHEHEKCSHTDGKDSSLKCASSSCSRTASTITDFDNDSMDLSLPPSNDKTVRSVIDCTQICCAAEIPAINKVLDPQDGIVKVLINVPNKCVLVDHDPSIIAAVEIVGILNKAHFGASLKRDGGGASTSTVGRSQLLVKGICCASEIPSINLVLVPLKGVVKTSFNIQSKLVFVDHDTQVVSAQHLCDALNEKLFGASVHHDARNDQTETLSTFVRSTIAVIDGLLPPTEQLKLFMSSYSGREMESFVVDTGGNKIHIVHNPLVLPIDDIVASLQESTKCSLQLSVEVNGADNVDWEFPEVEEDEDTRENVQPHPKPTVMLSGLFWILSMLSYIGGGWEYLKYLALVSVSVGLPTIGVKAVARLRSCQFDTNVLVCSAVIGALAIQEFAEAAAVTFLFSISDWLETRATTRARNALSEIVKLRPSTATIFHPVTKELIVVPASAVPVGALVSAKAGAQIPCDGIIVGGKSVVDESSLTGESRPVKKGLKDKVNGGTINSGLTELLIRTTCTAEDSAVSRLIRLVEEAQSNRSETEKIVDAFAKKYTPVVIACAALMVSLPWFWGSDIGKRWTETGLILLVVACPCALIISTPVTYVAGLAATAQRGILVKGGAHLEALGKVKKIAFDKTGTLTKGQFALLHLKCFGDGMTREDILGYLALIEERASHPIGKAIVSAVKNEGVTIPKNVPLKNLTELEGKGVTAMAGSVRLYVGNQRLFEHIGFDIPEASRGDVERWAKLGGTVGYLGVEGHGVVCAYCCADSPREESAGVLQSLRDDGIDVVMLTGDNKDASLLIGAQIGLNESDIQCELLPEDKLAIIGDMITNQKTDVGGNLFSCLFDRKELVMMCGDGVNDAPALAKANIGVAMGAGAALAMETSDMTLLDSSLDKLLYSIKMGKAVSRKIRENIIFSFVTKAAVVGTTLAGYSYLWAAIAVDVGSMLIVTLNGMTLLPSRRERLSSKIGYNELTTTEDLGSDQI